MEGFKAVVAESLLIVDKTGASSGLLFIESSKIARLLALLLLFLDQTKSFLFI